MLDPLSKQEMEFVIAACKAAQIQGKDAGLVAKTIEKLVKIKEEVTDD